MTTSRLREGLASRRRRRVRRKLLPSGTFERRTLGLLVVYACIVVLTVGKLVSVQVLNAEGYAARGADQRDQFQTLAADRGRIYDRDGEVLAASVTSSSVWADPRRFIGSTTPAGVELPPAQDLAAALDALTPLLGVAREDLETQLTRTGDFVWLARQLDVSVGEAVEELGLKGVAVRSEPRRVYPGGSLAAQVLGTTDIDGVGLGGMELRHDSMLHGQPGWLSFERGSDGAVIPSGGRETQTPVPGTDVVLTLDRQLQYTAERVANEVIAATGAVGASIVVLEVGTGDILAMASAPTVDLNERGGLDPTALRNRGLTDNFEPGSVQKAITAAAAIEEGVVTPDSVLSVADNLTISGKRFTDSHEHATEDMTFAEIIETSSNVGTIMVAQELGEERLASWMTAFGYGKPTEVGFPGEAAGIVRPVEDWWGTSLPTMAIGQGVAVTLLQAANAYATIANDGVAVQPRLVRGTVGADGVLQPLSDTPGHRVIAATTAEQVRAMLTRVVSGARGTGKQAAVQGYAVAGKTGTARKPSIDGRGYSSQYIASFVGMAPADDPRLVVAVMVDEPTPIYGGLVAAPAFSSVMSEALRRSHVPSASVGPSLRTAMQEADLAAARAKAERIAAERAAEEAARAAEEAAAEVEVAVESPTAGSG